jgi:hypothetical protein
VDYRLNADTGKLGLWPGGFLNVHAMSSYGTSVNTQAGALVPVNGAALVPPAVAVDEPTTALMGLTFTQFLTPWLGVFAGKIDRLVIREARLGYTIQVGKACRFVVDKVPVSNIGARVQKGEALAVVGPSGGQIIFPAAIEPAR